MLNNLPDEILLKVFSDLRNKDLINVSEVSKRTFSVATDPTLWRDFNFKESFSTEKQINLLRLPRFRKLKSFEISNTDINGELDESPDYSVDNIQEILKLLIGINLEVVTFRMFDFKEIDPKILSEVVRNTTSVRLEANSLGDLSENQLLQILINIPGGKVKNLQVNHVNFYNICPSKVAKAINSLEAYSSEFCLYSPEQISKIFLEISVETKLKTFSCSSHTRSFLRSVEPGILSEALNNLENLFIGSEGGSFSSEQMFEFFLKMSQKTRLQRICLMGPDNPGSPLLQTIPANILSGAIQKLEAFVAPELLFSPGQTKCILDAISMESSRMKRIDLGSTNRPTLTNVEFESLRKIVSKVEDNTFKSLIQIKIIETYNETIRSLREEVQRKIEEAQKNQIRIENLRRRKHKEIMKMLHFKVDRAITRGKIQLPSKSASYNRFKAKSSAKRSSKPRLHVKVISKTSNIMLFS